MKKPAADDQLRPGAHVVLLQPAFLGDAVLSTAVLESWHRRHPDHTLSVVVRKAAAGLFEAHPFLKGVHVWDRTGWQKYPRLMGLSRQLNRERPDVVINLHRFASMALLARRSGAAVITGFESGTGLHARRAKLVSHEIGDGRHETERNHSQVEPLLGPWDSQRDVPRLHPGAVHRAAASAWPGGAVILAPASVWATKRWPAEKWAELADACAIRNGGVPVVLLGGKADAALLIGIAAQCKVAQPAVCAGELNLLGAAALMSEARAVVSNDSAPLHMAGAVDTPVVGVFCSTTPRLGFGALPGMVSAGRAENVEVEEAALDCKPCGVHGRQSCPVRDFKCGDGLEVSAVLGAMERVSSLPS